MDITQFRAKEKAAGGLVFFYSRERKKKTIELIDELLKKRE
jgi:hypothetical protein